MLYYWFGACYSSILMGDRPALWNTRSTLPQVRSVEQYPSITYKLVCTPLESEQPFAVGPNKEQTTGAMPAMDFVSLRQDRA